MAAHSNRSPSPLSSRPIPNPNSRNSENNSAARRSFSGNNNPFAKPSVLTNSRRFDPITPANSPSGSFMLLDFGSILHFARRRPVGKEGSTGSSLKDCEEKENDEKDFNLKSSKIQSPAKGSKNFMSPTISAASKFTPSPRKKVLVERNDPVRTSISLSDGKAMFFSAIPSNISEDLNSKSEMDSYQNPKTEIADFEKEESVREAPPISKPLKRVTFSEVPSESQYVSESLSESIISDSDTLKLESSLKEEKEKVSSSSVSPSIAPLDADPSLPPYDPKNNYLSPRPQFLHYKPKPRIEILLNKQKGLDPDEFNLLEDNIMAEIMSDNFSESECTEESQTEDSQKEQFEVTASVDMVIGAEETENESLPVSTTVDNATSEESLVPKRGKKQWGFSRLMCFSLVMMFLIACASISVMHSPAFDGLVLEDFSLSDVSNFYYQSRFAASTKVNLDRLARHVNELSVNVMSFISKITNELGKGEKLGPLQFVNLTDLQMNTWNGAHFMNNEVSEELVEDLEEDEMEEELDTEMDSFEEDRYEEVDSDESFEKEIDSQDDMAPLDFVKLAELESENLEIIKREVVSSINTDVLIERNGDDQLVAISQDQESKFEVPVEVSAESEKSQGGINFDSSASLDNKSPLDVNSLNKAVQSLTTLESPPEQSENKFLSHYVMGISSLLAAALSAVAAFVYRYKTNPTSVDVVVQTDALLKNKHIHDMKPFSQNWQTEVDEISESSLCPSEMSSFRKSALSGRGSEVQSFERKSRKYSKRESLASSSSELSMSPSYGSFTTYERIPIKHANGDDEIITPVRRSSRIRNHLPVTSP
ncbi:hypothetical protein BUALT_Bualt15G0054100 [Buddleja alternifolia]|uniref:Transmembrane protein n=1 Tax=Buddleja alternifolia TaxID=168488 RepID=A0AAV6WCW2_9LAMI|nr:hypothetical protein BUALT_Bualt15G0054100 [Buddleja alternifolia]